MGMSKPEGLYLSADFRVTQYPGGELVDDAAVKLVTIEFPPLGSGSRALLGFTGLARLRDELPVGTWLVETMRGESEYPDQAFAHLLDRLNRDIAPLRIGLIINVLVIEGERGERRLFGVFSNLRRNSFTGLVSTLPKFEYQMQELDGPFLFANGSGAMRAPPELIKLASKQVYIRPRRAMHHMKLLASINRRIAAVDRAVSPACHVAFVPAAHPKPGVSYVRFGPTSRTFAEQGEPTPTFMPMIHGGVDLAFMMRDVLERFEAMKANREPPPDVSDEEINRRLRRRE
jgi:hypothetical protein